jgi:hypothetical protein
LESVVSVRQKTIFVRQENRIDSCKEKKPVFSTDTFRTDQSKATRWIRGRHGRGVGGAPVMQSWSGEVEQGSGNREEC